MTTKRFRDRMTIASSRAGSVLAGVVTGLVGVMLMGSPADASSDWVNDWFQQQTTTSPGHFEGQQRGYYSGGGFDARWRMSNDHLVSANPPSIKIGCGGIDIFGGSMSYMNEDYLVQKLQGIIQAAPAFAFQLAMQEYCKPCEAVMNTLNQVTDELNQLQLNDCQASQKLAAAIVDPSQVAADLHGVAASAIGLKNGLVQNYSDFQSQISSSGGKSPAPLNNATSGCPADFQSTFLNGSVVDNVTSLIGLNSYAGIMRGLVGDVVVTWVAANNDYSVTTIEACPGNNELSFDDFLEGTVDQRPADGSSCSSANQSAVRTIVQNNLDSIATKLSGSGSALSSADQSFIDASPIPLYAILKDAQSAGLTGSFEKMLVTPLSYAYAHRILDDLYKSTSVAFNTLRQLQANARATSGQPQSACDVGFLNDAFVRIADMRERSLKFRTMAAENYHKQQSEFVANLQVTKAFEEARIRMRNEHAVVLDKQQGGSQ
jgi:conjugative transfer pilus assembly protein TraH